MKWALIQHEYKVLHLSILLVPNIFLNFYKHLYWSFGDDDNDDDDDDYYNDDEGDDDDALGWMFCI